MISTSDVLALFSIYLEGFLYGNVSVLCYTLAITVVAKQFQLFPGGLGVYSGIFAIYLQFPSKQSRTRTTNNVFYILCLLYVFCTVSFVGDLVVYAYAVSSNNPIYENNHFYHQLRSLVSIRYRLNFQLTHT